MPAREIHISHSYWMLLFLGSHLGVAFWWSRCESLGMGTPPTHYTFFQYVVEEIGVFSIQFQCVPQLFWFDPVMDRLAIDTPF